MPEDIRDLKGVDAPNPEADAELMRLLRHRGPMSLPIGEQIPQTGTMDLNMPLYPVSPFAPDPPVLGGPPEVSQLFQELLRRVPSLKGQIKSVQYGPNASVIQDFNESEDMGGQKFLAQDFDKTSTRGLFDPVGRTIALNPRLATIPTASEGTLVHEMAHAAGHGHGDKNSAYSNANRAKKLYYDAEGIENPDDRDFREYQQLADRIENIMQQMQSLGIK